MPNQIRAVILCEDRQQEVFARAFLETCGIRPLRVLVNPAGMGSGEQFVREKYPNEVQTFRSKFPAQPNIRLVVMTDADTRTVTGRFQQLESALRDNGVPIRQPHDRIGVFIPKRNIETWIHYLKGRPVNEEEAYPYLDKQSECKPEVEALARNRRAPLPENAPPSMRAACQELPRILTENA
jgi:hypothetical protein